VGEVPQVQQANSFQLEALGQSVTSRRCGALKVARRWLVWDRKEDMSVSIPWILSEATPPLHDDFHVTRLERRDFVSAAEFRQQMFRL
jgi:hypothetical protein